MKYPYEVLERKFSALSPALREIMTSEETGEALQDIGRKHGLHVDELGELFEETALVILGMTGAADFVRELERRLPAHTSAEVNAVAADVNLRIFDAVREALKHPDPAEKEPVLNREALLKAIEEPHEEPYERPREEPHPEPLRLMTSLDASGFPGADPAAMPQEAVSATGATMERTVQATEPLAKLSGATVSSKEEVRKDIPADPYREPIG